MFRHTRNSTLAPGQIPSKGPSLCHAPYKLSKATCFFALLLIVSLITTACQASSPPPTPTPAPTPAPVATPTPEPVKETNKVIILGNNYSIPKIYEKDGEPMGILVDILAYADAEMKDYEFEIQLYPWARTYESAVAGKGGIIGLSKTKERLEIFDYSEAVFQDEVVLIVRKGEEFSFEKLEDLKGKTVGIGLGGSFGPEFEEAKKAGVFKIDEDNGPVQRLKKLQAGRIDVALINPGKFAFYETIKQDAELQKGQDTFTILPNPLKKDPNYLGFAKQMNQGDFIKEFNAVIQKGNETGVIPAILKKYESTP